MSPSELTRARVPAPLRISLWYAAFGITWIVLGDLAVWLEGGVTRTALILELGKGALFVGVSALLLHVMIRREVAQRQRAAAQLETVLDTAPVGIAAIDADGTVRGWNTAASRILGWSDVEVAGRSAAELGLLPAPGTERGGTHDVAVCGKNGASVDLSIFMSRVDSTTGGARVLVFRDRRPQIEIEAALRQAHKLEAVGRLAGGVAHEFNNILTTIIGHAALLIDRLDGGDDRREHAEEVRRSADRAAALTRQLLVFSGKHISRTSAIDLGLMLSAMQPAAAAAAGDAVKMQYELADQLWPVRCDVAQLEHLMLNLIVNAREAMPDGGTCIVRTSNVHVETMGGADTVPPGDYVLLSVRDTGRGISQDALLHLFEPFFTTKEQGTGLGLAAVHGIVQQSDGHIRVRSRPGHGAVFDIYLPRASAADRESRPPEPRTARGATLLVVEDDDAVRDLTCRILRRQGHNVIGTASGHEALAVLGTGEDIRLVIADIVMPGMNGIELGEHIRRDFPDLPILFTSGYVAPAVGGAAGLVDGSRFMAKPYTPDELIARVRERLLQTAAD